VVDAKALVVLPAFRILMLAVLPAQPTRATFRAKSSR